jgi:hypothetical protein
MYFHVFKMCQREDRTDYQVGLAVPAYLPDPHKRLAMAERALKRVDDDKESTEEEKDAARKLVKSAKTTISSNVSVYMQRGKELLQRDRRKGIFWTVYRINENWTTTIINATLLEYLCMKSLDDRAKYVVLQLLLPSLQLPLEVCTDNLTDDDLRKCVNSVVAGLDTKQPDTDDAPPTDGDSWPIPSNAKWAWKKYKSGPTNSAACIYALVRQLTVAYIEGRAQEFKRRIANLDPGELLCTHITAKLQEVKLIIQEVWNGDHDARLISDMRPFALNGTPPKHEDMKKNIPRSLSKELKMYNLARSGRTDAMKIFEDGELCKNVLDPLWEQMQQLPAAGDTDPVDIGGPPAEAGGEEVSPFSGGEAIKWSLSNFNFARESVVEEKEVSLLFV